MSDESVLRPDYYGGKDNPYEVWKVIRAIGFGFALGNVFKYIARAGKKDPNKRIQDLKKARECLDDEIAYWEQQQAAADVAARERRNAASAGGKISHNVEQAIRLGPLPDPPTGE